MRINKRTMEENRWIYSLERFGLKEKRFRYKVFDSKKKKRKKKKILETKKNLFYFILHDMHILKIRDSGKGSFSLNG